MALLKKIKAATLMETLVATVLIFVVFLMASAILNNLFSNTIKSNTRAITTKLYTLQYLYDNGQLQLPYQEDYQQWHISAERSVFKDQKHIVFSAEHQETKQELEQIVHD